MTRTLICPLRLAFAACVAAALAAGLAILSAPALGAAAGPDDRLAKVHRLLATPVDIPLGPSAWPMPAADFIALIKKQVPGLAITVGDRPEWASAATAWPPRLERPEAFCGDLHQIPVSEALNLCARYLVVWEVLPEGVLIRGSGPPKGALAEVRYPVGKLLAAAAAVRPPKNPEPPARDSDTPPWAYRGYVSGIFGPYYDPGAGSGGGMSMASPNDNIPLMGVLELETLLKCGAYLQEPRSVAKWSDEGGPAEMKFLGNPQSPGPKDVLCIRQTPEGHHRIATALEALCRSFGVEYAGPGAAPLPAMDAAVEKTRRLLGEKIDVDLKDVSLPDALAFLCKAAPGLQLVANDDAATKIRQGPGLTVQAKGLPVLAVLELCAWDRFGWEVRPGYIGLKSGGSTHSEMPLAVYPVGNILAAASGQRGPRPAGLPGGLGGLFTVPAAPGFEGAMGFSELVNLVKQHVNSTNDYGVAQWSDEGGPAYLQFLSDRFIVNQTPEGHSRIAQLLAMMCRSYGVEYAGPGAAPAGVPDAALERTRRLLEEKIDVDFKGATWPEFLAGLEKAAPGLCLVADPSLLPTKPDWGHKFWVQAKGLSVRTMLELCARDHCTYEVRPGWVALMSKPDAPRDLPLAVYPVEKLLAAVSGRRVDPVIQKVAPPFYYADRPEYSASSWGPMGSVELLNIVKQTVNPETCGGAATWSDEGGPATVSVLSGRLWVGQTHEGQDMIARLLAQIAEEFGQEPPAPVPPAFEADEATRREVRQLLARKIDVDFWGVSMVDAAEYLRRVVPGLNIVLAARYYEEGADDVRLWLIAKDTPVETVLGLMGVENVYWQVWPGCVYLAQEQRWSGRVLSYPIGDILAAGAEAARPYPGTQTNPSGGLAGLFTVPAAPPFAMGSTELINITKQTVNSADDPMVAQWSDEGGPAVVQFLSGHLIVAQSDAGQRKVEDLLAVCRAALTRARQMPVRPRAPVQGFIGPGDKAVLHAAELLETRLNVDFHDAPAGDVLATIATRAASLRFVLSKDARQRLVGAAGRDKADWPGNRLTLKAQGVTCAELLRRVLGKDLHCRICADALVLGLMDQPHEEILVPETVLVVYPVRDLIGGGVPGMGATELIVLIRNRINAASSSGVAIWSDEGGPGVLQFLSGLLLVHQTPQGHAAVKDLLDGLRQEARSRGPAP